MNKIIVANWKLNGSKDLVDLFIKEFSDKDNVVFSPPLPFLQYAETVNSRLGSNIKLASQDCSLYANGFGSYTGESSCEMIKLCGASYVIVGHSERRSMAKESNEDIAIKVKNSLKADLTPIICVGENIDENKSGNSLKVIIDQIEKAISDIDLEKRVIIAYEPIWAIGTGITPTPKDIQKICFEVKKHFSNRFKLLYGGSVNSENAKEILSLDSVDGLLIGKASLSIDEMNSILAI